MIKELMLIGALTFAPITMEETTPTEPTTGEVTETPSDTTTEEDSGFDIEALLSEFLDAKTVGLIMSWLTNIGVVIGLLASFKKLKAKNNLTLENVQEMITKTLAEDKVALSDEQKANIEAYLPSILKTAKNQNDIMKALIKIIALAQKDDEASRLAILEVISSLGVIDKDITDEATENVKETATATKEKKEEAISKVDDMIIKETTNDGTSI